MIRHETPIDLDFLNGCHYLVRVIDLCNKLNFNLKQADAFATFGNVKKAMELRREILCDIDAAQNALDFLRDSLPEDAQ